MKRITALAAGVALLALAAGCGSAGSSADPSITSGTAAVPCSVIAGQVSYLAQFITIRAGAPPYPADLYPREMKLANMFGNVSNADQPLALSGAEVDYELAVTDTPSGIGTQFPVTGELLSAFTELAQACGIAN
jgi:hypothetical protein